MSFDLYCYKPSISTPDVRDAENVLDFSESRDDIPASDETLAAMSAVADALVRFDSQLEILVPDFEAVAKAANITLHEAKVRFGTRIEINTPENAEEHTQIEIFPESVSLSCALGASDELFDKMLDYVNVIANETGYFLYDPQDRTVSDPLHPKPILENGKTNGDETERTDFVEMNKPWWKFW